MAARAGARLGPGAPQRTGVRSGTRARTRLSGGPGPGIRRISPPRAPASSSAVLLGPSPAPSLPECTFRVEVSPRRTRRVTPPLQALRTGDRYHRPARRRSLSGLPSFERPAGRPGRDRGWPHSPFPRAVGAPTPAPRGPHLPPGPPRPCTSRPRSPRAAAPNSPRPKRGRAAKQCNPAWVPVRATACTRRINRGREDGEAPKLTCGRAARGTLPRGRSAPRGPLPAAGGQSSGDSARPGADLSQLACAAQLSNIHLRSSSRVAPFQSQGKKKSLQEGSPGRHGRRAGERRGEECVASRPAAVLGPEFSSGSSRSSRERREWPLTRGNPRHGRLRLRGARDGARTGVHGRVTGAAQGVHA